MARGIGAAVAVGFGLSALAPSAAAADTITVSAKRNVLTGSNVRTKGALASGRKGRAVYVQLGYGNGRWKTVGSDRTDGDGRYLVTWRAGAVRHHALRVITADKRTSRGLKGGITIYRRSNASWYGPGFYGNRTACGRTLTTTTIGVAHRRLPCGTKVRFYYRGRKVIAPVIDRGPFHRDREWDLTAETKRRLNFPSTGTIWSSPSR